MRHLTTDPDVFVRTTYARGLVRLADAAITMLELSQATKTNKAELEASGIVEPDYDSMLDEIQAVVEEQATTLLVDPSSQVKRAFLESVADLCLFFGRQKSNETVLSHIMTYLNDRDWLLRLAFFDGIVDVGAFIGIKAVEEYVLPLMLQALAGKFQPENPLQKLMDRLRRSCSSQGHSLIDESDLGGSTPQVKTMGCVLRYTRFPVSSKLLDTPRLASSHASELD